MGVSISIAVEGEGVVDDPPYEGKYLADDPVALDTIARKAGAPTLLSLMGDDPGDADWDSVLGTEDGDRWFDPDLAMRSFSAILDGLAETEAEDEVDPEDWACCVRWTLEAMTEIAQRAKLEKKRVQLWGSW